MGDTNVTMKTTTTTTTTNSPVSKTEQVNVVKSKIADLESLAARSFDAIESMRSNIHNQLPVDALIALANDIRAEEQRIAQYSIEHRGLLQYLVVLENI